MIKDFSKFPAHIRQQIEVQVSEKPKRPRKYRNKPCSVDGIRFDSKAEMRRYCNLKNLEMAGEISDLRLQVKYPLEVNGSLVCTYVADFVYRIGKSGETVVEDAKGGKATETAVFRIKSKLMRAIHGITITIV